MRDAPTSTPAETLRRFLAEQNDAGVEVTDYRLLPGGMSRVVAQATVRWSSGAVQKLIVRSDPPTEGLFHSDRDAEWRLLSALNSVAEPCTPTALWYDCDGSWFATKTIVTDFCEGQNLHHMIQDREQLDARAALFCDTVASIHNVPLAALPQEMVPACSWDDYIDGQLDAYARAERTLECRLPVFRYLSARLRTMQRPPEVPFSLVHGDAQPGNVMIEPGRPPLVIDWEFTRVGDPREDLGYYAQIPMPPNLYGLDPDGYLARYREATGMSEEQVNPATVDYFRMLGMASLLIQIAEGSNCFACGGAGGMLLSYLINALSYNWTELFRSTQRITANGRRPQ